MNTAIRSVSRIALSCVVLVACGGTVAAQDGGMFAGKEISLLIGAGAGGGADTFARLYARHASHHLPGKPTLVPKNMQGAGGMRVANQIFNVSPRDGTEISTFATSGALQPLFRNPKAKYDTVRFTWIGNMDSDASLCGTWKHTGIKTWQDLKNRETRFGAGGIVSATSVHPRVVGEILGVKVKVIHGYQGTKASNLAMQRGEVDGLCGLIISTVRTVFQGQVKSGDLTVWMTFGKKRSPDFPNVPTVYEVVKNEDDRMLAELLFSQDEVGRTLAGPPGLSQAVTTALRRGFDATMKDTALLAEAKRLRLQIEPMTGEETEARFRKFFAFPAPVVERLKGIINAKKQ
jgi:tripartite-type tricarboxylate transporter receptor subunit TctC